MPCLFLPLYQKAVLEGRGFKPKFLVNLLSAIFDSNGGCISGLGGVFVGCVFEKDAIPSILDDCIANLTVTIGINLEVSFLGKHYRIACL